MSEFILMDDFAQAIKHQDSRPNGDLRILGHAGVN